MSVILGLMEIHDSLAEALVHEEKGSGAGFSMFCRRLKMRYRSHVDGLYMLQERVLALLCQCGVEPIDARGHRFDPHTMQAVGFRYDAGSAPGTVCDQQRIGFTRNGRMLRPAEVVVAKGEEEG